MRVLLLAPHYDQNTPGESWSTYKWIQGISQDFETTVLTTHKRSWSAKDSPTNAKEIVNWVDPTLPSIAKRLEWELKPTYLLYYFRARRWLKKAQALGRNFEIIHQINPLALRYPSPAYDSQAPLVIGPLAGSLQTPQGFQSDCKDRQWYRKLRTLDSFRLRNDPYLRRSYRNASLILGVAPYVENLLSSIGLKKFSLESETGVESVASNPKSPPTAGETLKLLFVGRLIRTKGVIDAIRAIGRLPDPTRVEFNILGDGDLRDECEQTVRRLGLSQTIHFHGKVPRKAVDKWYNTAHVFLFPSFREPSGNVIFEAMSHGLPIITAANGGPGYVVNNECGYLVVPTEPNDYSMQIANCIARILESPEEITRLSQKTLKRIESLALWKHKWNNIREHYLALEGGTGKKPNFQKLPLCD